MLNRVVGRPKAFICNTWNCFPTFGQDNTEKIHNVDAKKSQRCDHIYPEVLSAIKCNSLMKPKYGGPFDRFKLQVFTTGGMFSSNSKALLDLRGSARNFTTSTEFHSNVVKVYNGIADEFVEYLVDLSNKSHDGSISDIIQHLYHWSLENFFHSIFNERVDRFRETRLTVCNEMVKSGLLFLNSLVESKRCPSMYEQLSNEKLFFYQFSREYVNAALNIGLNKRPLPKEPSLLDELLRDPSWTRSAMAIFTAELVATGFLTTAVATCNILYTLGQNESLQDMLFYELSRFFPFVGSILVEEDHIKHQLRFLEHCCKESLRLFPATVNNGRLITKEGLYPKILLNATHVDHIINPDYVVLIIRQKPNRRYDYILDPEMFQPERYIKREYHSVGNIWVATSDDYGATGCLGIVVTSLQTSILLAKLLRQYRVVTKSPDILTTKSKLINVSEKPVNIKFIRRAM
uniref:Cytochrome P450 3197A1 n=1 Tax=Chamberlinius hualienensis TaxID=1551368 RepID=A0A1J1E7L8_9MYRI|nr:cytochrome P450 3197A1 [Chamberlinius hualienensis]